MLKNILLLFQISVLIFLIGCSSSYEDTNFKFGKGKFNFVMYDSSGNKLADGILNVQTHSSNNISGTYEFKKIYQNDFPGLSSMNGAFEGNILTSDKKVFINTNPKIADSNVFWNFVINKNSLSGDWTYSTFKGTGNKGRIKVTK